jgi:PAS domain S-box-containing protein
MINNRSVGELRHQAEEQLLKKKQKITAPSTPEELRRLVQELEVHQIELEMQNEELQQARSDLEKSLNQYTDLYDFAPVGYFTLDQNGIILNVNLTGARMLGMERSRIVKQHFKNFVLASFHSVISSFLEEVFRNRTQETIEIVLQKEEKKELYAHVEAIVSENRRECRVALVDITAQKQSEKSLQESELKYRSLYENMSQGVLYQEPDGKIISANPAAEQILDMPIEQMQGKTLKDLNWQTVQEDGSDFPEEAHPSMVALRTGEAVENVVMCIFSPQSGRYRWLKINAVPKFLPGKDKPDQVFITFEDISHLKRMVAFNMLTPREKEVFKLLAKGYGRQVISKTLNFSPKTADKHKENLMEKLNLYDPEGIIEFARLIRLIET